MPDISDSQLIPLIVGLVICGSAWGWLQLAHKGFVKRNERLEQVLALVAMPLGALLSIFGLSRIFKNKNASVLEEQISVENEGTENDRPRETEAEHVRRVLETAAEEAETHIEKTATDDEVAARGAALFDPGLDKPSDTEDTDSDDRRS